jgi:uroporphyrin-III C-methyltransferase
MNASNQASRSSSNLWLDKEKDKILRKRSPSSISVTYCYPVPMNGSSSSSSTASTSYPIPVANASLLLSFRPAAKKILITGTKRLAASRIFSILEADAIPIVVGSDCQGDTFSINEEVQWRILQQQCQYLPAPKDDSRQAWQDLIESVDGENNDLFAVCVTDTLHAGSDDDEGDHKSSISTPLSRAKTLVSICKSKRIPINVADQPSLCDYSFPASHRFSATPSPLTSTSPPANVLVSSSLQIAVTTNGKGCRLAGRIRREIVSKLPRNVGDAVERVGEMRELAKGSQPKEVSNGHATTPAAQPSLHRATLKRTATASRTAAEAEEDDLTFDSTPLNSPVPQLASPKADGFFAQLSKKLQSEQERVEETRRRMRWVAQMSEYWPIEYLGNLSAKDMAKALDTYVDKKQQSKDGEETPRGRRDSRNDLQVEENGTSSLAKRDSSQHSLSLNPPERSELGHIFLVGSGTGHPGLLTKFAHNLLTSPETDLILSDKLVPSSILSIIPKTTPLQIARKFPGNAEGAQSELISLALQGAIQGKRVIRLKQGDPFIYGRGGEEILAFRKAGIGSTVVPGISSALAAPLMLGIPVTQRGAADSLTLCTGVGRGGKSVRLPGYERCRSLIVLMGVARLKDVVKTLCHGWQSASTSSESLIESNDTPAGQRVGEAFPPYTPIAIIERASSSDQRLVASTLEGMEVAMARVGEQRPPGMMLIGWAALSLSGINGNVDVLDDETECGSDLLELERRDRNRVNAWLGEKGYLVKEGLDDFYSRYSSLWESGSQEVATAEMTHNDVVGKGASGWAPPRYGEEGVRGGWGHNEKPLTAE